MEGESFEQQNSRKSRLEDHEFFAKIRDAVAERLDDLVTDPKLRGAGLPLDLGERIRRGEKVAISRLVRDAVIGVGDDLRLTRDEIDILEEKFLEINP